jgi:hypothetical protein
MKKSLQFLAGLCFLAAGLEGHAASLSGAFSYQGRLDYQGSPANGTYDLSFRLFDSLSGGNSVAGPLTNSAVAVTGGVFTVVLDFGSGVFGGASYWLEVGVRTNWAGAFTTLSPRQPVLASPYASFALNAESAATASSVPAANISGQFQLAQLPAAVLTNNVTGVNLGGIFSGNGGNLVSLNANSITGTFSGTFHSPIVGWTGYYPPYTNSTQELAGSSMYSVLYGGGFIQPSTNTYWLTNIRCAVASYASPTQAIMRVFQTASSGPFNAHTVAPLYSNMVTLATSNGNSSTNNIRSFSIPPATVLVSSGGYVSVVFESSTTNTGSVAFACSQLVATNVGRLPMLFITSTNGSMSGGSPTGVYDSAGYELLGYVDLPVTNLEQYIGSLAANVAAQSITNASLLPYNNVASGLGGLNVQAAIDELAANAQATASQVGGLMTNSPGAPRIILPDEFTAVVGDELQLFVRGMIEAENPYNLPYVITCAKGATYPRYWDYTPAAGDIGSQKLSVSVTDLQGNTLASGQTTVNIVGVGGSPVSTTYVMCIGDSLTAGGTWPQEFYRRLTQSGGTPKGDARNNIQFIGDRAMSTYPTQGLIGYGGWSWPTYEDTGLNNVWWVTAAGHDKTQADIGNYWVDPVTGKMWTLMGVTSTTLKLGSPGQPLPAAVYTLTNLSHSSPHSSDISFTATNATILSPLNNTNGFSFAEWTNISIVYVLLGWNELPGPNAAYATNYATMQTQAQKFINQLHSDFPNALVRLVGLEVPSINGGLGANYGATGSLSQYYNVLRSVNGLNLAYQQLCNSPTNSAFCRFINISCQFDSEYNMSSALAPVNSRNATTEQRGANGVHPATPGYLQIADAVWRDFVRTFCQ